MTGFVEPESKEDNMGMLGGFDGGDEDDDEDDEDDEESEEEVKPASSKLAVPTKAPVKAASPQQKPLSPQQKALGKPAQAKK